MATATLTFNLPDEDAEFRLAVNASSWHTVAWEVDQQLRSEIKYASDDTSEAVIDALQKVRDYLNEVMISNGVRFE